MVTLSPRKHFCTNIDSGGLDGDGSRAGLDNESMVFFLLLFKPSVEVLHPWVGVFVILCQVLEMTDWVWE